MPETKSQRMRRQEEEAQAGREKEDDSAESEKESQDKVDEDPTGSDGADDDNPDKQLLKHTSKLDKDFETILRMIFKIKNDNHEVFEALHSEGIYSWESFIDVDSIFINDLTKATTGNRVPVLYQTKAILKSLLFLYLKSQ